MGKKIIRLTENQLHNIIKESVNQILNEFGEHEDTQHLIGQAIARRKAASNSFDPDSGYYYHPENMKKAQELEQWANDRYAADPKKQRKMKFARQQGEEDYDNLGQTAQNFLSSKERLQRLQKDHDNIEPSVRKNELKYKLDNARNDFENDKSAYIAANNNMKYNIARYRNNRPENKVKLANQAFQNQRKNPLFKLDSIPTDI